MAILLKVRKLPVIRDMSPYNTNCKTQVLPVNKGFFKIGCGKI